MCMQIECDKRKKTYSHLVTLKCENKDTFIDFKYTVFRLVHLRYLPLDNE